MNCGAAQCTEPNQLTKLAKLVESRLAELPPEAGHEPPPSAKPQEEQEKPEKQEEPGEKKP